MQCASSTTNRASLMDFKASTKLGARDRSGATLRQVRSPARSMSYSALLIGGLRNSKTARPIQQTRCVLAAPQPDRASAPAAKRPELCLGDGGRQLIAKRFTRTSRHHDQQIVARNGSGHSLFLQGAESGKSAKTSLRVGKVRARISRVQACVTLQL